MAIPQRGPDEAARECPKPFQCPERMQPSLRVAAVAGCPLSSSDLKDPFDEHLPPDLAPAPPNSEKPSGLLPPLRPDHEREVRSACRSPFGACARGRGGLARGPGGRVEQQSRDRGPSQPVVTRGARWRKCCHSPLASRGQIFPTFLHRRGQDQGHRQGQRRGAETRRPRAGTPAGRRPRRDEPLVQPS